MAAFAGLFALALSDAAPGRAMNHPMPAVLTVKEVADYLRISPSTVYRMLRARKLPVFKIGTDWRFNKDAIDKWMQDAAVKINHAG
jgi:excisionase family DNA binding protein